MQIQNEAIAEYLKEPDVHEVRKAGSVGAGVTLVVSLVAVVLHAINTYLLFWEGMPVWLALIFHVALAAVVLMMAAALKRMVRDSRFMLLLGISTAALGIFGAVGTFVSILLHFWHTRISQTFAEWFATIFPKPERSKPEVVYEDILYGRDQDPKDYQVIPFMDVISIGSETQKRRAISRMTEFFEPHFAPAFLKALHDPSNSIRVQAATAVSRIENQFLEEVLKINALIKKHPKDPVIRLALAEHYDNYAFTGILDEEREASNRQKALENYRLYLDMKPKDIHARIKMGRLLLRMKDYNQAADWFRQSIDAGYLSDSLLIWYVEALYASGRFTELRKQARGLLGKVGELRENNPALVESIMLWAEEDKPSPQREAA